MCMPRCHVSTIVERGVRCVGYAAMTSVAITEDKVKHDNNFEPTTAATK